MNPTFSTSRRRISPPSLCLYTLSCRSFDSCSPSMIQVCSTLTAVGSGARPNERQPWYDRGSDEPRRNTAAAADTITGATYLASCERQLAGHSHRSTAPRRVGAAVGAALEGVLQGQADGGGAAWVVHVRAVSGRSGRSSGGHDNVR